MKWDSDFQPADVLAAFRLLFAPQDASAMAAVGSIQPDQIKAAYRRKALATHPDRFAGEGEAAQRIYTERFIQISRAYEVLNRYVALRRQGARCRGDVSGEGKCTPRQHATAGRRAHGTSRTVRRAAPSTPTVGSFWQRDIPRRYLRFAEFLYFSRVISWRSLVDAIVWQRRQRPRLGEIARKWRWVDDVQVEAAVRDRRPGERIGEVLVRHGMVTSFGLGVLLRQQQRLQKPIGLYFVKHGLMSEHEVGRHLHRQHRHNMRFAPAFSGAFHGN